VRGRVPVFVRESVYSEEGKYPTDKRIVKSETGDATDIRNPINARPKDENSSISVTREAAAVSPEVPKGENSSIAHELTSCQKFFPAVGMPRRGILTSRSVNVLAESGIFSVVYDL